ncbi:MAG: bifunctional diguanylate cyclase/phosphodiesterase [Aquincola sp.]|nr:bifunctional diguanylate cyclase/phosphodiesterase [Aquincola sp.]
MLVDSSVAIGAAIVGAGMLGTLGGMHWRLRRSTSRLKRRLSAARSRAEDAELRDPVTGVLSRRGFARALDAVTQRPGAGPTTVLCIGLDAFRIIQDAHGHAFVDQLLSQVVQRLVEAGGPSCTLGRLRTSQFGLLVPGLSSPAMQIAEQLRQALAQPFEVDAHEVGLTASVGVASGDAAEAPRLLSRAVMAMSTVLLAGGDDRAEFDPRMAADHRDQAALVRDLSRAIERKEFELFYQPKVDSQTLQVTAAEALLRWRHPSRGMISPALFIPLAERHGLIAAIGNWVLDEALCQAAAWRKNGMRMRVAINVSGYQMRQDDFAARLERGLRAHGLQPGRFTCEITESTAMEDTAVTHRAFARLGKIGVHVSIDDFGTGHSSLAALRRLPAGELKIDRAFVADLAESAEARTIVEAIVQMAHTLRLRVVAEGVETVAQRDHLMALGCDEMQGYLFAKPMTARALSLWAADASAALTQTFSSSLFKETLALPGANASRPVLLRSQSAP